LLICDFLVSGESHCTCRNESFIPDVMDFDRKEL